VEIILKLPDEKMKNKKLGADNNNVTLTKQMWWVLPDQVSSTCNMGNCCVQSSRKRNVKERRTRMIEFIPTRLMKVSTIAENTWSS